MEDVNLGNICDLWVNGKMISTPNTLSGNNKKGVKDNIVEVEIAAPIVLKKERIELNLLLEITQKMLMRIWVD